jgi:UDP-N-acetylmuramate dehydrogenase
MNIQQNISLALHTTFKIGGSAHFFVEASSRDELMEAYTYADGKSLAPVILAGGSNVLFPDKGYPGSVIKIAFSKSDMAGNVVTAEAGCSLMNTIMRSAEAGLSGWESMYGIPGTVGGAVRGNAGAFGVEIKDVLTDAEAVNTKTGELYQFSNTECRFAYRDSFFKQNPEWLILSARFSLPQDTPAACVAKANGTLTERSKRQIQNIRSAGSFFMNPVATKAIQKMFEEEKGEPARGNRVPAGWLIDKAGFKGVCRKEVCTGARSSNYFINNGNAKAADVLTLAGDIKAAVLQKYGIELKEEVTLIGF